MSDPETAPVPVWIIVDPETGLPVFGRTEASELAAKLVNHQWHPPAGVVVQFVPAPAPKRKRKR